MHLSEEQKFNQALIKLAVLFYQVDRKILLSEQDYLEELVESLEWDSPICREAYVNEVIYQTRPALDTGDAADILRSLQADLDSDKSEEDQSGDEPPAVATRDVGVGVEDWLPTAATLEV